MMKEAALIGIASVSLGAERDFISAQKDKFKTVNIVKAWITTINDGKHSTSLASLTPNKT